MTFFTRRSPEIKPVKIIGFDTEDDTYGRPLSFAFFSDGGPFYTTSPQEAVEYVYDMPGPACFAAHNLEYDIGNLFKHCDWKYVESMLYAGHLLKASLVASPNYFINSFSFFSGKLSALGEIIGLPKLEGDPLNKEYNIRDAEIVYRFLVKFQEQLNNDLGINLGITIGQLAMNAYRKNYMLSDRQETCNDPMFLKAYYGGRVEIFNYGAVENVIVSDINSSYPNVMRNYSYPDTGTFTSSKLEDHEYGIGKFKVRVPASLFVPPLPYKASGTGRLFFPTGTFTGRWTYAEMRAAQSLGVEILKEYEGKGTNTGVNPFDAFVDDFYKKRLGAKRKNDAFGDLFYKLFQNNLYGKWCQHRAGGSLGSVPMSASQALRNKMVLERRIGPRFYQYRSVKEDPPDTANFAWGVYVTSYARIYLLEAMIKIHEKGGRLIYCDTDSIMFSGLKKNPLPVGKKLGQWDEEKYDLGVFRQLKGYLLCNRVNNHYEIQKCASKGVPTDYAYDFIIRGAARFLKPMRFKESIVRLNANVNADKGPEFEREMGVNYWNEVEKVMKSVYIKRVEGGGGVMLPIDVKDIGRAEESLDEKKLSIEKDLKKKGIRIKRRRVIRNFRNVKVPSGWEKRNKEKKIPGKDTLLHAPVKLVWLKSVDCTGLETDQHWFAGHVVSVDPGLYGKYYRILLTWYKNEETPPNFYGAISVKFFRRFGLEQNLKGNFVDVKMRKVYIPEKDLHLNIQISNSELCAPSDEEIDLVEQLDQAETENLMGADWSFLNELKK